MSEIGEAFNALKEIGRAKRLSNLHTSIEMLTGSGVPFKQLSETHFLVNGQFDFWPSTGLFICRKTLRRRRGVNNLLKEIKDGPRE